MEDHPTYQIAINYKSKTWSCGDVSSITLQLKLTNTKTGKPCRRPLQIKFEMGMKKPWVFHSNWSLAPARGAQQQCVIMAADGDNELGTFDHLGGFFQA